MATPIRRDKAGGKIVTIPKLLRELTLITSVYTPLLPVMTSPFPMPGTSVARYEMRLHQRLTCRGRRILSSWRKGYTRTPTWSNGRTGAHTNPSAKNNV